MIPNIPTDNLYKFVFVAGIALCLFGIYSYTTLSDTYIEQKATRDVDKVRMLDLFKNSESLTKMTVIDTQFVNRIEKDLIEMRCTAYKHWLESEIDIVAYPIKSSRALNCIRLGLVMAVIGGFFWYYKVQRHQDNLLRSQIKELPSGKPVSQLRKVDIITIVLLLVAIYLTLHNEVLKYILGE